MSLPNVSSKTYSLSAIIFGYLLIDDLTANEQNALGNWLMLTAQVLCTNAFYRQVQAERMNTNINRNGNNNYVNNDTDSIEMLEKMIIAIQREIEILKENK
ncbi:MAG: hypothetical protein PUD59_03335 [bacterium]|nr:hypothetical protein [bacterium]